MEGSSPAWGEEALESRGACLFPFTLVSGTWGVGVRSGGTHAPLQPVLEGGFSKGGQGWPELETKVPGKEDKRPVWRQVSVAVVMCPLAPSSGRSYCHMSSPDDHSTSFQVTLIWPETHWFTEFSNWRKRTGEGDLVRGKTRSGIDFGFSLNHRQGKLELSFIQGPPSRKRKSQVEGIPWWSTC